MLKIIEYGLYLLIFLLPVQIRWIVKAGVLEYFTISLYGTDILLLIVLTFFIVSKFSIFNFQFSNKFQIPNSKLKIPKIWWLVGLIELAAFISIFFAPDKLLAVYAYVRLLLGIGLFWVVVDVVYDKTKLIWSFLFGAVLQAGLGIWQFLTQSSFASKWLGMAAHNAGDLGTSVVETLAGERWLRAYGGLDHPNILGGVLAVGVLLVIGMLAQNQKSSPPKRDPALIEIKVAGKIKNQNENLKFKNVILLSVICYLLSALFFTFSRGAWAGVIVGVLAMLIMVAWRREKNPPDPLYTKGVIHLLVIIFVSAIFIGILFTQYSDLVLTRLSRDTRLEVKSNTERIESYKSGWQIIKNNWLTGAGIGNYVGHNMDKSPIPPFIKGGVYVQPPHNVFLLVWAETGILGLLGFLGLLGLLGFQSIVRCQMLDVKQLSILFALIVIMSVDHWLWSLHFGVLFFWFILGLIAVDFKEERHYN